MLDRIATNPLLFSFAFVFFAELGDKTLFTLVLLSSRNRAIPVMLGGWAAFVVQGLIAVLIGSLLGRLPAAAVRWGTAAVFLGCGLWLLLRRDADEEAENPGKLLEQPSAWKQFLTAFGLVFLAEWGDATQVGSAALVARLHAPVQVFLGATLGLWAGTVLAVIVGRFIGDRLPSGLLRRVAGGLFCLFAVLTALRA